MIAQSQTPKAKWCNLLLAFVLLAAVNIGMFYPHYLGEATFPWDFLRGYHAHAYGWYAQGGVFSPPKWFPWSSMGFPAALAIQSGAWYLPLIALDFLNIAYSIQVATIVQCLHVLLGAIGAYILFCSLGFRVSMALLGALCFELSAGFYSNQQHVDIIRAYALFPWVLWVLLPSTLQKGWWAALLATLILFQFLIAAYPGNIVTTAYAVLGVAIFSIRNLETGVERKRYAQRLVSVGIVAVLLSGVKWFPYAMQLGLIEVSHPKYNPFEVQHLLTLLFNYDVPYLTPGIDVTARSVFLPSVVLVGLAFASFRSLPEKIGVWFVLMALTMGAVVVVVWPSLAAALGLRISRFPLTDWRPVLTFGLLFVGLSGWQMLFSGQMAWKSFFLRNIGLQAFLALMVLWGAWLGYESAAWLQVLFWVEASVLIGLAAFWLRPNTSLMAGLLILVGAANGVSYQNAQQRTWLRPWSNAIEQQHFGQTFEQLNHPRGTGQGQHRRPPRLLVEDNEKGIDYRTYYFNSCWYSRTYCVEGYDNLKYSIPHKTLFFAIARDDAVGKRLKKYVLNAQQLLVRSAGVPFDIGLFPDSDSEIISLVPGVKGEVISYGSENLVYRLSVSEEVEVVENELWWPGWQVQLCDTGGVCKDERLAGKTTEYLRAWSVPPGVWKIRVQFKPEIRGN